MSQQTDAEITRRAFVTEPESLCVGHLNEAVRVLREANYQQTLRAQDAEELARVTARDRDEQKAMLGKALEIKNKYLEEREALKLELNGARFELGVANEALAQARERQEQWRNSWVRLNARVQWYRSAVRKRLTTIADRVGLATATLQLRIEELEGTVAVFKENLAQERAKVNELERQLEDKKYEGSEGT